jgi:hypothetical protein
MPDLGKDYTYPYFKTRLEAIANNGIITFSVK